MPSLRTPYMARSVTLPEVQEDLVGPPKSTP